MNYCPKPAARGKVNDHYTKIMKKAFKAIKHDSHMKLKEVMKRPLLVHPSDSRKDIINKFNKHPDINTIIVVNNDGKFLGEIHEKDLLIASLSESKINEEEIVGITGLDFNHKYFAKTAKYLMDQHEFTMSLDDELSEASLILYRENINCIPVLDRNGKVKGMIDLSVIIKHLQ